MKNHLITFLAFILLGFSLYSQKSDTLLVAYWSFNDSTANDQSGNGYHGTFKGNPKPINGVNGSAMRFIGCCYNEAVGDYMILPRIKFEALKEFTISLWVNEESLIDEGYGPGEAYINWGNHSEGWIGIMNHYLQVPSYDKNLFLMASVGSNYTPNNYNLNVKYNLKDRNKWVFYCLAFKNDTMYFYKDKSLLGKKYQKLKISGDYGAVGRHWWNYGGLATSNRITASFDEIKIFKKALTPDEINKEKDSCGKWSFDYNDFSDIKNLKLLDYSVKIDKYIRLTPTRNYKRGAIWYKSKLPLNDGFKSRIKFRFSESGSSDENSLPGADGIAFVMQNTDTNQIGLFGGGIGYEEIKNGIALEFDSFSNDSTQISDLKDPNGNHFAVQTSINNSLSSNHGPNTIFLNKDIKNNLSDGSIYETEIEYNKDNKILIVSLIVNNSITEICRINNFELSKLIKLDNDNFGYLGITSATGNAYENHDILSFSFCSFSNLEPMTDVPDIPIENNSAIEVFPNPSDRLFNFIINENIDSQYHLTIYNSIGYIVYQTKGNTNQGINNGFIWEPSGLGSGVYFYNISTNCSIKTGKLIFFK